MKVDPGRAMMHLLRAYPEEAQRIVELVNRQRREHRAIAEAVTGEAYALPVVTVADIMATVKVDGPNGLLSFLDVFCEEHAEIMRRLVSVLPVRDNLAAARPDPHAKSPRDEQASVSDDSGGRGDDAVAAAPGDDVVSVDAGEEE